MTDEAIKAVIIRNAFYRRLHYYALAVLLVAVIVIGVMICVLVYISGNYNPPLYFATDKVGRLIKIVPDTQPNMSEEDVISWSVEAVQAAYSFDYVNYRSQLQSAQKYFTEYGWSNYMSALKASNNLLALNKNKMVVTAAVVDKPKVITRGLLSGAYAWRFSMPVLVTYLKPPYDDTAKATESLIIEIIVQRQSILKSYQGLGILQLIGKAPEAPINTPTPVSTTPT